MARPIKYKTDEARDEAVKITQRLAQARFRKRNPGYRNQYIESHKRYIANNKIKIYARHSVYSAIKKGKIIIPIECERCGTKASLEADHADYTKRLEVTWLCKPCHQIKTDERRSLLVL